ncbi:unnamed protein product, partial [Dibothriocephalus latus]
MSLNTRHPYRETAIPITPHLIPLPSPVKEAAIIRTPSRHSQSRLDAITISPTAWDLIWFADVLRLRVRLINCRDLGQLWTRQLSRRKRVITPNASGQAAHSTGPGRIFKFDEAEILARDDNRVTRELLQSRFSGPQSINKRNDVAFPYSVLRHCLSKRINQVGRAGPSNNFVANVHNCRAIIKTASTTDKEIAAINE